MPFRREASRCPKAITRQSYYESRISGMPDILSTSRETDLSVEVKEKISLPTNQAQARIFFTTLPATSVRRK
jgi:hypothetical protein